VWERLELSYVQQHQERAEDYRGEIDVFDVYSPHLSQVFIVPIGDVPSRVAYLRLRPARNGQAKGIHWARDYALTAPQNPN
jgi:hypothetical protein